jgi:ribonuclease PH
MKFAEGSALIEIGDTRVLVGATIEHRVPPFLANSGKGWLTAEYAMLPRATDSRSAREVSRGKPSGRSSEIQRLIGRSLRSVVDLKALADLTLILDCDVLQADGGTRTAAITGAYVAAAQALGELFLAGDLARWPLKEQAAAISVGVVDGEPLLDLDASEDRIAEVDMNVVATSDGNLIEVQGTGERHSFPRAQLDQLLDLALSGISQLAEKQNEALGSLLVEVNAAKERHRRPPSTAKDESDLWNKP